MIHYALARYGVCLLAALAPAAVGSDLGPARRRSIADVSFQEKRLAVVPKDVAVDGYTPVFHFAPDGRSVAYVVRGGGGARVVRDDEPGEAFDDVGMPIYGPDGTSLAYRARKGAREFVVLNGRAREAF